MAVDQRAVLQGAGNALQTDKFVEWYTVHRETVYWAIYHGKLNGEIQVRPAFDEVIYHRARYQSSSRKHREAGCSHCSTRSRARTLQKIRPSIIFRRNVDNNPRAGMDQRIDDFSQSTHNVRVR
jgi:hypothetical protein